MMDNNFKLREYNLIPEQKARGMKIEVQVMQADFYRLHQRWSTIRDIVSDHSIIPTNPRKLHLITRNKTLICFILFVSGHLPKKHAENAIE